MKNTCIYIRMMKYFVTLALINAAYCCKQGQLPFQRVCFEAFHSAKDYSTANIFCKSLLGELANVSSRKGNAVEVLRANISSHEWINYWVGVSATSLECLSLETVQVHSCDEKKFFICEIPDEVSTVYCPEGSYRYEDNCLRHVRITLTYSQTNTFCTLTYGQVVTLADPDKQQFIKSIGFPNLPFWVSAKKVGQTIKWPNGEVFDLNCTTCNYSISDEGKCVHLTLNPFLWNVTNCSTEAYVLCENRASVITTPAPTTTEAVLSCPHGYHWKLHEDSGWCFWETTYETERANWYGAREFCGKYGGDLASYKDYQQEVLGIGGASGHSKGLWIGLKRGDDNTFHWSDGSVFNYSNWEAEEPILRSRTKSCVIHGENDSKWKLDYCGVRRWFVCKAPQVAHPIVPDTSIEKKIQCNFTTNSIFREWYLYGDHCYLLMKSSSYSWNTAQTFCEDNESFMASVHSFSETNFILSLGAGKPETNYWIGSSAVGLHSSLRWVDDTPVDFFYWSEDRALSDDVVGSSGYCVSFNDRDGSWTKDHCNRLQGVICKRHMNSSYVFTSPPPTPITPGFCPNGSYTFGNKCYKIFGKTSSERTSYALAEQECAKIGHHLLVSIHSQDEQDFITDLILELGYATWIGLKANDKGNLFTWTDGSAMDFTNWDELETQTESSVRYALKNCVAMKYMPDNMGKWSINECFIKNAFICQLTKDSTLNVPYHNPFLCPNRSDVDWWKLGTSCFKIFDDSYEVNSWLAAQSLCRLHDSNLMSINNVGITLFLKRRLANKNEVYWTGIRETLKHRYQALNGQPLIYTNWLKEQPVRVSELRNCVAIDSQGKWMVRDCYEKHPFVCEQSDEKEIDIIEEKESRCPKKPDTWKDFGGDQCFLVVEEQVTWSDALGYCYRQGGYLASLHSEDDVRQLIKHYKSTYYHIGLGRLADGSYGWVDRSPLDYSNWATGEPDNPVFDECIHMTSAGKWRTHNCRLKSEFVCSAPKVLVPPEEEEIVETVTASKQTEDVKARLEVGGILGIVICVSVILAIIGVASYYMCPCTRMLTRLREPESP